MVDRNPTAYLTILYGVAITGNIHLDHFPWLARRHLPLPLTSKSALPASGPGATRKRRTKEKLSQTNTHQKGGNGGTPPHRKSGNDGESSYVSLDAGATRDRRHPGPCDRWAITVVTRPSWRYISRSKTGPCDILPFPARTRTG